MSNRHEITLDPDSIRAAAEEESGVALVDEELAARLVAVVTAFDEAGLSDTDRSIAAETILDVLITRSRLEQDAALEPRILEQRIEQPIMVAGAARAGTTFLHALLDADPASHAPQWWEVMHPSPPPGLAASDDPRHAWSQHEMADYVRRCPRVKIAHPYVVEGDGTLMECEVLMTFDLRNTYPYVYFRPHAYLNVPKLLGDPVDAYGFHRRMLQQLQYPGDDRRWALKGTAHHQHLAALFTTYPDAIVVWTHRDPVTVLGSLAELVASQMEEILGTDVDRPALAQGLVLGNIAQTDALLADPLIDDARIIHLRYPDMTADPVGQLHEVYERAGLEWTAGCEQGMRAWLDDPRHDSGRYGTFSYSMEALGLSREELDPSFAAYRERFGLTV